jgi:hypothetical protein
VVAAIVSEENAFKRGMFPLHLSLEMMIACQHNGIFMCLLLPLNVSKINPPS